MRSLIVALALVLTPMALAQERTPPENAKHLKQLAWMIGKWKGTGKMDGQPFVDEAEYSWIFNKTFIKAKFKMFMGKQLVWSDSTIIGWDRDRKTLVWFAFGLDGSIGGGDIPAQKKDKPKVWLLSGGIRAGDKRFEVSQQVLTRKSKDVFSIEIQTKQEKKWVTFLSMTHKRVKPKTVKSGK